MQIISNDKRVRSETVREIKFFKSRSLSKQVKEGEQLIFL